MRKRFTLKYLQILLLFILPYSGWAAYSVNVLNAPQQLRPGEFFTLFIEVKTDSQYHPTFYALLGDLPQHWRVMLKRVPESIKTDSSLRYVYTIATPRTIPAGEYVLNFKIFEKGYININKEIKIKFNPIRKIEVIPITYPDYLKEGETLQVEYLIQNAGNQKEKLRLSSEQGMIEGIKTINLNRAESAKVLVKQYVPTTESGLRQITTDLKVSFDDTTRPVYTARTIPVYSTKSKKSDPYFRFPIDAGVVYQTFRNKALNRQGLQFEIKGAGYLDISKKHYLDFIARNSNQYGYIVMGSYEQYSANYAFKKAKDRTTEIALGDYNLKVTNLIEMSRFGRGINIDHHFGKSAVSLFYQEPRFNADTKKNIGAGYTFKPKATTTVGLHFLSKTHRYHHQPLWSKLAGVSVQVRKKSMWLEAEAATDHTNKKLDFGWFSSFQYFRNRFRFNHNLAYAGKQFYGYYNNSWLVNSSAYVNFSPKITLGAMVNYNRINPSLDSTMYSQSPYSVSNIAEFIIRPSDKARISISYNHLHREDRAPQKRFNFKEDYLRYMYFLTERRFTWSLDGSYGYSQNLIAPLDPATRRPSIRGMSQMQMTLMSRLTLGVNAEYLKTSRYSPQNKLKDYLFYGGSVQFQAKKYFDMSLMFRNNYTIDELTEKRSFFDLQANLKLQSHQLSLVANKAFYPSIAQQNTLYFGIKYIYKINVPIVKLLNLGTIKGSILGIPAIQKKGILIQAGDQRFVSDKNGQFAFNNLVPNKYYISVVRSSLQAGDVLSDPTPVEVNVKADSTTVVNIPLIKSGKIVGKVIFEKGTKNESEEADPKRPLVLVKLYNEKETHMNRVNDEGLFSFKEVAPGNWSILVSIPGNQNNYIIDNSTGTVEVKSESSHELVFKIRPLERKVHFSENKFYLGVKK